MSAKQYKRIRASVRLVAEAHNHQPEYLDQLYKQLKKTYRSGKAYLNKDLFWVQR